MSELTHGEKQYLKGHGITEDEFRKMDSTSQQEWKDECKERYYEKNWSRADAKGIITFSVNPPPAEHLKGKETLSEYQRRKKLEKKNKS